MSSAVEAVLSRVSTMKCKDEKGVQSLAYDMTTIASLWLTGAHQTAYVGADAFNDARDLHRGDTLLADVYLRHGMEGLLYIDCKTRVVLGRHSGYERKLKANGMDQFTRPPGLDKATGYQAMFGKVRVWTLPGWFLSDWRCSDLCYKRS